MGVDGGEDLNSKYCGLGGCVHIATNWVIGIEGHTTRQIEVEPCPN